MLTVSKEILLVLENVINLPVNCEVLTVAKGGYMDEIDLYYSYDNSVAHQTETRTFVVLEFGSGISVPEGKVAKHIGSVLLPGKADLTSVFEVEDA
jgi:hypothetical protein